MEMRKLGNSGLEIAPLVFGGNVFGWTIDETTSFRLLDAFVDAGLNCVDTADVYSRWVPGNHGGESETIIGKWLKKSGKRDKIVLATKCGMEMGPKRKGLKKDYIFQAVDDSLKRLQTDRIDLYQTHTDDFETPFEETMEAMAYLIRAGKIRVPGASNITATRLEHALDASEKHGLPRYQTLQPQYNLMERKDFEERMAGVCQERGIGVITYFSLASGFLSGKYRQESDFAQSARGQGVKQKYFNERGQKVLKALDQVAEQNRSNPARVALAWVMAQPGVTAPIASATKVEQLTDLVEATRLKLDAASIAKLNEASAWF